MNRTTMEIGPVRPLSGAASQEGSETRLIQEFRKEVLGRTERVIIASEVPLPSGSVDLVVVRISSTVRRLSNLLRNSKPIASLEDRYLHILSGLRPNQQYRIGTLIEKGYNGRLIEKLVADGILLFNNDLILRRYTLPDMIRRAISYEFKVTNLSIGAVQAAKRIPYTDESWLVTNADVGLNRRNEIIDYSRSVGIGVWFYGKKPEKYRPPGESRPSRWSRFLVARSLLRGLGAN